MELNGKIKKDQVLSGSLIRSAGGGGAVSSVNGQTGDVVLDAQDVGALPASTVIPSKTSDLQNDSGFITASGAPVQSVNGQTGAVTVSGLSQEAKTALMDCFAHTAWTDANGQTYYNALASALGLRVLSSITAVFTQGSATIYDTYLLDALRQYIVVTANYSDSTTATVTDYTLSGTLEAGTSTITASYGGKSATFTVTVSSRIPSAYKQVEYIESHGNQAITTDIIPRNTRTIVTFEFTQFIGSTAGSGADNFVTGVYNANNMRYLACSLDQYNQFCFKGRDNSYQWKGPVSPTGKHTVDFNNASHQAIYDGTVRATSDKFPITSGDNKLAIFARGHSSVASYNTTYGYARIYSLRYEDNDTGNAVGEFIPCYRKADGVIGMYDIVSDTFYENVNSGDPFTKGDDAWETGT